MSDSTFSGGGAATPPPYYPADEKGAGPKQGLGCFVWGCLAVVAVGIVGTAAMIGLGYYGLTKFRDKYTDTQPAALPELRLSEDERKLVRTRFDEFRALVDQGSAADPLMLSEDELNALIAEGGEPNDPFRDAIRVEIEGDRLVGQISLPLDQLGLPLFGGRYLNGTAELTTTLKDGELDVRIESASVKGEALQGEFMSGLRQENLAEEAMNEPDARRTLQNLASIEIRDGQVIIVPKAPTAGISTGPAPVDSGAGS